VGLMIKMLCQRAGGLNQHAPTFDRRGCGVNAFTAHWIRAGELPVEISVGRNPVRDYALKKSCLQSGLSQLYRSSLDRAKRARSTS
jgi:hypothetical protein